jgi:hypothetical protein
MMKGREERCMVLFLGQEMSEMFMEKPVSPLILDS